MRAAGIPRGLGRFGRVGIGMRSVLVAALPTKLSLNFSLNSTSVER
jgi:hypothetical protein